MLHEALRIRKKTFGDTDQQTAQAKRSLGACLVALARYEEAETLLQESYTFYQNEELNEELFEKILI